MVISDIRARQVLDSRGNPTVEADVFLENGASGRAIVPSGASTGVAEALELRDQDERYFGGKSVQQAVWNVNHEIRDVLVGNSADQIMVDEMMRELDGTDNKAELGANAILAVSLATAKAVARSKGLLFCQYIAELAGTEEMSLPLPMMNIMNGGAHADWSTDIQEYMIVPLAASTVNDTLEIGTRVFRELKKILKEQGYPTTVGDEGGYAPKLGQNNEEPLNYIMTAITASGYKPGEEVAIALDVAASEFYQDKKYVFKTSGRHKSTDEMIEWYKELIDKYPIISIEDGLDEKNWGGWQKMTAELGSEVQLVGDDLFVTNVKLLEQGIDSGAGNAILIKPNQIGTLSETIEAVQTAKKAGYKTIVSHRSGETEDTSIAHIAVGLDAGQIKTGSMSRTDRICKYNELLRISEYLPQLDLWKS
ncbi:phosphopyruvate hydratase [Candidatus Saccharibacteria bacterium]|nr:phosphopyruvate hydratase [Candidatus Saccharibacteria bacterium]